MKRELARFKLPAAISALLVLPLMLFEIALNLAPRRGALGPQNLLDFAVLFGLLWLLPLILVRVLTPMLGRRPVGEGLLARPLGLLLRALLLLAIAALWLGIVKDQFPCFLGLPNCD